MTYSESCEQAFFTSQFVKGGTAQGDAKHTCLHKHTHRAHRLSSVQREGCFSNIGLCQMQAKRPQSPKNWLSKSERERNTRKMLWEVCACMGGCNRFCILHGFDISLLVYHFLVVRLLKQECLIVIQLPGMKRDLKPRRGSDDFSHGQSHRENQSCRVGLSQRTHM